MVIAPFLFFENVTAANTIVSKPKDNNDDDVDIKDDDIEPFWMDDYMSFD